jgi:hypothetical protein
MISFVGVIIQSSVNEIGACSLKRHIRKAPTPQPLKFHMGAQQSYLVILRLQKQAYRAYYGKPVPLFFAD